MTTFSNVAMNLVTEAPGSSIGASSVFSRGFIRSGKAGLSGPTEWEALPEVVINRHSTRLG